MVTFAYQQLANVGRWNKSCAIASRGNSGAGGKQAKLRKPKGNDLRRLREKLLEAEKEKLLNTANNVDKDDSSSTTTETSSIEADDNKVQILRFYGNFDNLDEAICCADLDHR